MATYYKRKRRRVKKSYWVVKINGLGQRCHILLIRRAGSWLDPLGDLARRIAVALGGDYLSLA
jgi:hypothetical protein